MHEALEDARVVVPIAVPVDLELRQRVGGLQHSQHRGIQRSIACPGARAEIHAVLQSGEDQLLEVAASEGCGDFGKVADFWELDSAIIGHSKGRGGPSLRTYFARRG